MVHKAHPLFSPRRIGVTGVVTIFTDVEQSFCAATGAALVTHHAVVVTRGRGGTSQSRNNVPVDLTVVEGAASELRLHSRPLEMAVETMLAAEMNQREDFQIGKLTKLSGRTLEAQRFAMINRLDGVIGIGGRMGTLQSLTLALATDKPLLPVPCFAGNSAEVWKEHRSDLLDRLGLSEQEAAQWERRPETAEEAATIAKVMVSRFLSTLQRRCFIIMPYTDAQTALYDFVIEPAVEGLGHNAIRIDRIGLPGDVGRQIADGIARADYVVVVLDGLRPNVLYELGLAHAHGKPTIILNQRGSLNEEKVPFDITLQQRIEYDTVDKSLRDRLQKAIREITRVQLR